MTHIDIGQAVTERAEGRPPLPGATTTAGRSPMRLWVRRWGERSGVVLIILGIVGLVQPLVQGYFTNGFTILLIGTIIFIIASHL
jgi:hypothetical protein